MSRPQDPVEYGRRNLLHCKSVGALEGAKAALSRLRTHRHPPRWLVKTLTGIVERLEPVTNEVAAHRNEKW